MTNKHFALIALAAALAACGPAATSENSQRADNAPGSPSGATASGANRAELPPVISAHGGGGGQTAPPGGSAAAPPAGKPEMDTAALDAKIKIVEAKARAAGAGEAEKKAAASAYVERGNVYRDAQQPQLYRYALGDYRRALRYDPGNAEARAKMDEIVAIYQGMGRPVPTNGLDDK
ncbi:MAG: hypothetical protein LC800_14510 [Acidobacteria bacterium]|nr:hypothetical protein [Acidobacteriota bacterium]